MLSFATENDFSEITKKQIITRKNGEVKLCWLPDINPRDWLKDPTPKSSRHSHSEKKLQGTVSLLVEGKKVSLFNEYYWVSLYLLQTYPNFVLKKAWKI